MRNHDASWMQIQHDTLCCPNSWRISGLAALSSAWSWAASWSPSSRQSAVSWNRSLPASSFQPGTKIVGTRHSGRKIDCSSSPQIIILSWDSFWVWSHSSVRSCCSRASHLWVSTVRGSGIETLSDLSFLYRNARSVCSSGCMLSASPQSSTCSTRLSSIAYPIRLSTMWSQQVRQLIILPITLPSNNSLSSSRGLLSTGCALLLHTASTARLQHWGWFWGTLQH